MTWLIVAGALGAIIITGGLFLRRLLGELAEQRGQLTEMGRQITGIDRETRALRAHVKVLRQMLADDGDTDDSSTPPQAVAVNGNDPATHPGGAHPIRRKRHLGLYLGGVAAALVTISGAAREVAAAHRAQVVGAVTGAAVTAATVTVVTVQPWTDGTHYDPPVAGPSVAAPPSLSPPGTGSPRPPGSAPPPPPAAPSATAPDPSGSPSPSASESATASARPRFTGRPVVPAGDKPPLSDASPIVPDGALDDTSNGSGGTPSTGSPGPSTEPPQPPVDPPTKPPPVPEEEASSGICLELSLAPLVDADACLFG
ncbi:DUF948 domain-containing protein [Streptomyces sp. NPDC044948]|uniref:DUF948 domain-containing protein n=1 Tax=Streptomyces sp. NPDC044948 TaxID=3157092 RepID=UPI0033C0A192